MITTFQTSDNCPPPIMNCRFCGKLTTSNSSFFRYCPDCNGFKITYCFSNNDCLLTWLSIVPNIEYKHYVIIFSTMTNADVVCIYSHNHTPIIDIQSIDINPSNFYSKIKTILMLI